MAPQRDAATRPGHTRRQGAESRLQGHTEVGPEGRRGPDGQSRSERSSSSGKRRRRRRRPCPRLEERGLRPEPARPAGPAPACAGLLGGAVRERGRQGELRHTAPGSRPPLQAGSCSRANTSAPLPAKPSRGLRVKEEEGLSLPPGRRLPSPGDPSLNRAYFTHNITGCTAKHWAHRPSAPRARGPAAPNSTAAGPLQAWPRGPGVESLSPARGSVLLRPRPPQSVCAERTWPRAAHDYPPCLQQQQGRQSRGSRTREISMKAERL